MALLVLIDDAPEVGHIVRLHCRRGGHSLLWFPDSDGVLTAESLPRPDLVLIDLNLANEAGTDSFRRLCLPPGPWTGVPAALFTQGASSGRLAEALEAGIDCVVSKELLAQPEAWKARLTEVLELVATPASPSVQVSLPPGTRIEEWASRLATALRHPCLYRLGPEVVAALLRRGIRRALGRQAANVPAIDGDISSATLAPYLAHLTASRADLLPRLVPALSFQAECLLGRAGSAPFRQVMGVLEKAVDGRGEQ